MTKRYLGLLVPAVACALALPGLAGAEILVDFAPSCAIEGARVAGDNISTAGDVLEIYGFVNGLDAYLGLDVNDPTKEYTYYIGGLTSAGTVVNGGPPFFYGTDYTGGTFTVYCDDTPDATPGNIASFQDGDVILTGSYSSFHIDTNSLTCAGNQTGAYQFTGGTLFGLVSEAGVGLMGENVGLFTVCTASVPSGCFGESDTKLDLVLPTPVEPATWGMIKGLYE